MEQESPLVENLRKEVEEGKRKIHDERQKELEDEHQQEQPEPDREEVEQKEQEEEHEVVEEYEEDLSEEIEEVAKEKGDIAAKKFAEMRKANKEKDREIIEMRERLARLEGAQEAIKKEPEPEQEDIPDKDEDPDAWYEYQLQEKEKKIENLNKRFDDLDRQTTTSKAEQVYKELEDSYAQKDDTYKDAKKHLVRELSNEIKERHPYATDAQVAQEVKRQEYELVSALASKGFGEDFIFDVIKTQAEKKGFKPKQQKKKNLDKLKKNIEKSDSLNDAPTGESSYGLTENQIARMSNAELARAQSDPTKEKQIRTILKKARMKARA